MQPNLVLSAKNRISTNRHIDRDMANVCYAIIDHVANGPKSKTHLTFADLYRISPKVDEDTFYDAVFLLSKHQYNILIQHFEAYNPRKGFEIVPDRQELLEAMRNNEFYNPFTGESLTEEQFGKEVITFFSPSDELIEAVTNAQ